MKTDIIIIGAGAAGLMAGWRLGKAGKKVTILEARDRIGGRIYPLSSDEFGYNAEGGAEFVHGEAPITRNLIKEAGLNYVETDGEMWNVRDGELVRYNDGPLKDPKFAPHLETVKEKLKDLTEDISIAEFLRQYFPGDEWAELRKWIVGMAEAYDLADPEKISTLTLREEWLAGGEWKQGKITEGYGALLKCLENKCREVGVEIILNEEVTSVTIVDSIVRIECRSGQVYEGEKVVSTLAVPVLKNINWSPAIPEKLDAAEKIGFGGLIRFLLRFKTRWWANCYGEDLSNLTFILSKSPVSAWWTQYPFDYPVITGWIPGPNAENFKNKTSEEIIEIGLDSLVGTFKVDRKFLESELVNSKVINWVSDKWTGGAYSYSTTESKEAYEVLAEPVQNMLFFAGEALCLGSDTATVEGALASGEEVADKILKL